jgi:dienelactone hydrolase
LAAGILALAGGGWIWHGWRMRKLSALLFVPVLLLVAGCRAAEPPPAGSFTTRVKLDGKLSMAVDVYLPEAPQSAPVVMLAHGFTQDRKYHANQGKRLAAEGYVVLIPSLVRFADHAGHGRDLVALLDWVERQQDDQASPLHGRVKKGSAAACGHSAGGLSALLAAAADPRIRVLVLLDAVDWHGLGAKAAANLKIPTLSVCAEASAWNANGSPEQLAAALPEPKRTVKIAGANHLEAQDPANRLGEPLVGKVNPERQQRFTTEMVAWIKEHLPVAQP